MTEQRPDTEQAIAALAAQQHGVVTRAQLLDVGVSADAIDRRLRAKRMIASHRGVYVVGPLRAPREREMAAVLACGRSAMVSHRSASGLWQLRPAGAASTPVDVIAPDGDHGRRPGILVHRVRTLRPDEVTKLDGIPVTSVGRTLYDLATVVDGRELERALAEAFHRSLVDRAAVLSVLEGRSQRPGAARLRELLESDAQPSLTRSEAEERFLRLIRRSRLSSPQSNVMVSGYEVDFFWRVERLVVEIDGFAFHSAARTFESDRRRDAVLAAAGLRVIRVTWRQLVSETEALLVRLALALARTGVP